MHEEFTTRPDEEQIAIMMPEQRMIYVRLVALSVVLMIGINTGAIAQTVARQGAALTHKFQSPMILEMPLPNVTRHPIGARTTLGSDIPAYTCDDVSLPALTIQVKKRSQRNGSRLVLEIAGGAHVPPSYDRLVDLAFVVRKGETVFGKANATNVDAEEGRITQFRTDLALDEAQLRDAFATEPHPTLELTVVVRNNG